MRRRDFFKGIIGTVVAVLGAPLAKLFEPRPGTYGALKRSNYPHADPGRIDMLAIDHWGGGGMKPIALDFENDLGAGILDVIEHAGPTNIRIRNGKFFYEGMRVDVYHGSEYFLRGSQKIAKISGNTVTLDSAVPGMKAGDLIVLPYQVGEFKGLRRSPYPGKLTTPIVDAGSAPLTPELIRQMDRDIRRAWEHFGFKV